MIIHLLSNPRNVSTALMYAFAQHPLFSVLDEPFYAYYLSRHGLDHPGRSEILNSLPAVFDDVVTLINSSARRAEHLFVKNMAHHLRDCEWSFKTEAFNIIFVRPPRDVLSSFAKVIHNPTLSDIAIKDQYDIFFKLKATGAQVMVLDATDLLANPRAALSMICDRADIAFNDSMLEWPSGPKIYDGVWAPYWYANVHKSTGFAPPGNYGKNPLPESLHAVLAEAEHYYDALMSASK